MAACKTFDVLLSDLEQPSENRLSKTQVLRMSVFVNDDEFLIMLNFAKRTTLG